MTNEDTAGTIPDPEKNAQSPEMENASEAPVLARIVVCMLVLGAGLLTLAGMIYFKEAPAEAKLVERAIAVETVDVVAEDVPVVVSGLGEVKSLNVVRISPEIAGRVVSIHPDLEVGEIIPAGQLLFQIDPSDYIAARDRAAAQASQFEKSVERLNRQLEIDRNRLQTVERSQALMKGEYERVKALYEQDDVGTQSAVDHSEMTLNQTKEARDQLGQAVALYPVQIEEAESALKAARAQLVVAEANLARTEVRVDFDARVKKVMLEMGQYVNPGMEVLTLADDSILEISVSLDSRDARNWLQFDDMKSTSDTSWFGALNPVPCSVAWTEDPEAHRWEGHANRVESLDPQTRTVSVAVRLTAEDSRVSTGGLPLVEGMFCQVDIPGKVMERVFRLPRWAVSYEGNVYLSRERRLTPMAVEIVRSQGDETFVRGLKDGDTVIVTRLVNPLPNTLLAPQSSEAAPS